MIEKLLESIPKTNPFGEKVTLVAAVKLQTPEDINRAIKAGITDIGDNHVQVATCSLSPVSIITSMRC